MRLDVLHQITLQAFAACSAAGAVITRDWAVTWLGAPLPVVLAAVAGAALVLSFLPPRVNAQGGRDGRLRTLGTVVFAAFAGIASTPLIASQWPELAGSGPMIGFAAAALVQAVLPLLIERRGDIVTWLLSLLPRGGAK